MLDIPHRLAPLFAGLVLTVFGLAAAPALAEAQMPGLMDYFGGFRRWGGDRVQPPAPTPRPDLPIVTRSEFLPLAVHADRNVSAARAREALSALEDAYLLTQTMGFEPPPPDGGRGGSDDFDLYLVDGPTRADDASADPLVLWTFLDSASAFATVDSSTPSVATASCVASAYAQAMLIGQDPAEAVGWRRATASYLSWWITGTWGCDDSRVVEQQQNAHFGWVDDDLERGDGGALLVAELAARHDHQSGRFVHDVWQIARQRTWEGADLRASPDLWEAIEAALEISERDTLEGLIEDVAVLRYFTGPRARGALVRRWARTLPSDGVVPVSEAFTWDALPKYTRPHEPEIAPFGSAYIEIDVSDAPVGERLRLWLRGEFGVRWSFVAVSLDGNGRELGRVSAPPRRVTRSYLQVDFTDRTTKKVVVVVTNLSARLPDADAPDDNGRSFRVIADRRDNSQ